MILKSLNRKRRLHRGKTVVMRSKG